MTPRLVHQLLRECTHAHVPAHTHTHTHTHTRQNLVCVGVCGSQRHRIPLERSYWWLCVVSHLIWILRIELRFSKCVISLKTNFLKNAFIKTEVH